MGVANGEMADVELGAARWKMEKNKVIKIAQRPLSFLVMVLVTRTTMRVSMVLKLRPQLHHGGRSMDAFITCFFFAFITMQVQVILAILLPKKAPPAAPRLFPSVAWMHGITVWLVVVAYFLYYANMSIQTASGPICSDWDGILAGVASVVNLAITVYIILRHVKG